ncbi:MAG TPA: glutaredoxin family protein [Candidatus Limnocylindrales bacterium]|jgi:glutaredoxin
MTASRPEIVLFTREGCHLCDETRAMLQSLLEDRAARGQRSAVVRERDIATDPELERAWFTSIPVLEAGGRRLELATSPAAIRRFLAEALDEVMA